MPRGVCRCRETGEHVGRRRGLRDPLVRVRPRYAAGTHLFAVCGVHGGRGGGVVGVLAGCSEADGGWEVGGADAGGAGRGEGEGEDGGEGGWGWSETGRSENGSEEEEEEGGGDCAGECRVGVRNVRVRWWRVMC